MKRLKDYVCPDLYGLYVRTEKGFADSQTAKENPAFEEGQSYEI